MSNTEHALAILDHLVAIYARPAPAHSHLRIAVGLVRAGDHQRALDTLAQGVGYHHFLAAWLIRQHLVPKRAMA